MSELYSTKLDGLLTRKAENSGSTVWIGDTENSVVSSSSSSSLSFRVNLIRLEPVFSVNIRSSSGPSIGHVTHSSSGGQVTGVTEGGAGGFSSEGGLTGARSSAKTTDGRQSNTANNVMNAAMKNSLLIT